MSASIKPRILLITSPEAHSQISNHNWTDLKKNFSIYIHVTDISPIAFITKEHLEQLLSKYDRSDFDFVLTSGLIPWDLGEINSPFSSIIKKGTDNLANLASLLQITPLDQLSSQFSATKLKGLNVEEEIKLLILQEKEKYQCEISKEGFILSKKFQNVVFSPTTPPVLLSEIIDTPNLPFEEICNKINHYITSGVDIVDLGCIVNQDSSEFLKDIIPKLKEKYNIPLSIDSLNPNEIKAAANAGIDMVLSISIDNFEELLTLDKVLPLVIIPYSSDSKKKVQSFSAIFDRLYFLYIKLVEAGFTKILFDPILTTPINPGFVNSIHTYYFIKEKLQTLKQEKNAYLEKVIPQMFMGFGNITELIDADSSGINSILTLIAEELDIAGILSTEASKKTRFCLKEVHESIVFAYYAKYLNSPPINMGISDLKFKFKDEYAHYKSCGENEESITILDESTILDPKGFFKIFVNETNSCISVSHFEMMDNENQIKYTFHGDSAESLYKHIINKGIISRLDHAAYLGKELALAEQALKMGTRYIQT